MLALLLRVEPRVLAIAIMSMLRAFASASAHITLCHKFQESFSQHGF